MKIWLSFMFTFLIFLFVFNSLALNRQFYAFLHRVLHIGVESETLIEGRENVLDFIKGRGELRGDLFTPEEQIHLQDIKVLMEVEKLLFLSFVDVFVIFYFMNFFLGKKDDLYYILCGGAKQGMILAPIFGAVFLVGFVPLFTKFHEIFFTNDFWLLDYEKHLLINILPHQFFFAWLGYFFGLSMVVYGGLYFGLKRFLKKS